MENFYHKNNRALQDQFGSRDLADRMIEHIVKDQISESVREFIEKRDMFFISTVGESGFPTVSYKGGSVGFVKVLDQKTIAFPGYDGNGMFLTAGNMLSNNQVGLLFIDFENQKRMRMHGMASVMLNDPLINEYPEAQYIVRIVVENIFPNCSRYIHRYQKLEPSKFVPKLGSKTPEPEWKSYDEFKDAVPKNT